MSLKQVIFEYAERWLELVQSKYLKCLKLCGFIWIPIKICNKNYLQFLIPYSFLSKNWIPEKFVKRCKNQNIFNILGGKEIRRKKEVYHLNRKSWNRRRTYASCPFKNVCGPLAHEHMVILTQIHGRNTKAGSQDVLKKNCSGYY